jgi:hypothetical protein
VFDFVSDGGVVAIRQRGIILCICGSEEQHFAESDGELILGDQPFPARTANRWDGSGDGSGDGRRPVGFDRHRHDHLIRLAGQSAGCRGETVAAGIPGRDSHETAAQD